MRRESERSLVLFAVIFVFVCLLVSGAPRLIGHEGEEGPAPMAQETPVKAQLCAAPAPQSELVHPPRSEADVRRSVKAEHMDEGRPQERVCADANGNILRGRSYLHEVYQAFSLGDGFV